MAMIKFTSGFIESTELDGATDKVNCGPGVDEVWINESVDHNAALECEIVHSG